MKLVLNSIAIRQGAATFAQFDSEDHDTGTFLNLSVPIIVTGTETVAEIEALATTKAHRLLRALLDAG